MLKLRRRILFVLFQSWSKMYNKIWTMLQVGQLRNNGSIPGRGKRFFSTLWHPNCLWATQSPIPWASRGCSSKVKWLQHKANHSPPQKAYVKNEWRYTSLHPPPKQHAMGHNLFSLLMHNRISYINQINSYFIWNCLQPWHSKKPSFLFGLVYRGIFKYHASLNTWNIL